MEGGWFITIPTLSNSRNIAVVFSISTTGIIAIPSKIHLPESLIMKNFVLYTLPGS